MRLTAYSDYSLRVLMYVGLLGDERATIDEICEAYGISRGHVMKIVNDLGRMGYLETIRGRAGGLKLAIPPEAIGVGEVIRKTETDFAMVPCFESAKLCPITPSCALKGALALATREYLKALDQFTLADLIAAKGSLRKQLGMAKAS